MPDQRRSPRRVPAAPPARPGPHRLDVGAASRRAGPARADPTPPPRRPRPTGRAAILVLVLAVLAVSYASSMRAYLQQRSHIEQLKADITEHNANIAGLEREKRRWDDPAYQLQQARKLGYVMPGETPYVVLDEDGRPLGDEASLTDPASVAQHVPRAWYADVWASVVVAGNPPPPDPPPAAEIDGSDEPTGE